MFPYKWNLKEGYTANNQNTLYDEPRYLNTLVTLQVSSFPLDYDFLNIKPDYLMGMSVPPVMMAQVAHQVYKQLIRV